MKKALLFVVVGLALSACGSHRKDAASFETLLEQSTGQPHKTVKLNTAEGGDYVVFQNEATGEYVAYNLAKFDRKKMTNMDQFLSVAVNGIDIVHNLSQTSEWVESGYWHDEYDSYWVPGGEYWDSWCECYVSEGGHWEDVWVGSYWVDTSHYATYYIGGGFKFDNTTARSKDLEMVAALQESVAQKFVSTQLATQFSLSHGRADELAKLVTRYQKLENARELTVDEKNVFAKDALGVSMADVEKALKEKSNGRDAAYKAMLEKAAQTNKTTAEQIGGFFDKYVGADAE